MAPRVGEFWDLIFLDDELVLRRDTLDGETVTIPYTDITAIEFGGAGETQTGGGFLGGGFGLAGAAEGMLIASALNMLTVRRSVDTVICLQTRSAELFFHDDRTLGDALRIALSPVFSTLRTQAGRGTVAESPAASDHVVERLTKLADLLERGHLTDQEFQQMKRDLLAPPAG